MLSCGLEQKNDTSLWKRKWIFNEFYHWYFNLKFFWLKSKGITALVTLVSNWIEMKIFRCNLEFFEFFNKFFAVSQFIYFHNQTLKSMAYNKSLNINPSLLLSFSTVWWNNRRKFHQHRFSKNYWTWLIRKQFKLHLHRAIYYIKSFCSPFFLYYVDGRKFGKKIIWKINTP